MKLRLASILSILGSASLIACGGGDGDGDRDFEIDPNGTDSGFVASSITVPASSGQAGATALDIDGDGDDENALGQSLGLLGGMGIDLQGSVTESVNAGSVIILANIKATALDNATGVGVTFYLGSNPMPAACTDVADPTTCGQHLDGSGSFDVSGNSPTDALVGGNILGGTFETRKAGQIPIELELVPGQPKIVIDLIGARATFKPTASGLTEGILGGAITEQQATDNILPVVVTLVMETIGEDCTLPPAEGCCPDGSTGGQLLDIFDANDDDCMVTAAQVQENDIVSAILGPDIDLLDADGNFNPNSDGVDDAISLGLGFTGVPATFTP